MVSKVILLIVNLMCPLFDLRTSVIIIDTFFYLDLYLIILITKYSEVQSYNYNSVKTKI